MYLIMKHVHNYNSTLTLGNAHGTDSLGRGKDWEEPRENMSFKVKSMNLKLNLTIFIHQRTLNKLLIF